MGAAPIGLRTNLHLLDDDDLAKALAAVAASRGWALHLCDDADMLAKATGDKAGAKPLGDPVLEELLKRATKHFDQWLRDLLKSVQDILGKEPVLPLTEEDRDRIKAELKKRKVILVYNFTGEVVDAEVKLDALRHIGLIDRWTQWPAAAARYGAAVGQNGGKPLASYTVWTRQAETLPLGPLERQAIQSATRSAGQYLTAIADHTGAAMSEIVMAQERRIVMQRISTSIATRRSFSGVVSDLFWDLKAKGINRDFQRVVRTEMMQAFHLGNHAHIRKIEPDGDPLVFKIVRPDGCVDCRRIWMNRDGSPILRKLSEVEKNGDSNFGRKRAEWKAVVGPTHVNCLDSALQRWTEGLTDSIFQRMRERKAARSK